VTASRDEIRDHLQAVIEAARELPRDDRAYLADTFLDDLEKQYQLVPRSGAAPRERLSGNFPPAFRLSGRGMPPIGLIVLAAIVLIPALLMTVSMAIHPPIILLAVLLFFVVRSGARRGPRSRGPRNRVIV
jgi:hypothetical protein